MYPGDLLCILVTPPAGCQEWARPCGGIHQASACLGSWARRARILSRLMVAAPLRRPPVGDRPASPEAKAVLALRICQPKLASGSYPDHRDRFHMPAVGRPSCIRHPSFAGRTGRIAMRRSRRQPLQRAFLINPVIYHRGAAGESSRAPFCGAFSSITAPTRSVIANGRRSA